jgi:Ca2+:H+ antiporter
MSPLYFLLVFAPLAIVADLLGASPVLVFASASLGVVPLAGLVGEATEELAVRTGPRLGGLLNATLGNAAELIITIFAIRAGLLELVKASITGSILGNLLLVMGFSILLGGLKNGTQYFDRSRAGLNGTMLILVVIAFLVPSLFGHAIEPDHEATEGLSLSVAVVMILVYGLGLVYSFTSGQVEPLSHQPSEMHETRWSTRTALAVLLASTVGIAWLSEVLVGSVEHVTESLGWSEFFVGIIIVPIVGNVAEHLVAVQVALKDKMELSLSIALDSSLQIALFVAPVLVFVSLLMGNPMDLIFNQFELIALAAAALIAALVALDGESNWLEGVQLLVVYVILAIAFFFLPTG